MCIGAGAEEHEDEVSGRYLGPDLEADVAVYGDFRDGVEAGGVVDARPGVGVGCDQAEVKEEEDGVGEVEGYDEEGDDEEADEARGCGVAREKETVEFAPVAVEAVDEEAWMVEVLV
jgi:hypothetical protein